MPVDPWAGVDTGSWDLHSAELPPLPPTLSYPTPPATGRYPGPAAGSAPVVGPATPPPSAHPATPPQGAWPVSPAARPVSPPPPVARPLTPTRQMSPPAPPRQVSPPTPPRHVSPTPPRHVSPTPPRHVSPTPPRQVSPPAPPRHLPPARPVALPQPPPSRPAPPPTPPIAPRAPRRRRRRWPWVLLLSIACCCGCPAYWVKPMWEQYPAKAALPQQISDLSLRDDARSQAVARELENGVRQAHVLTEDTFAGVYTSSAGKPVAVFGGTGFRLTPESDADDELTRLTQPYQLREKQVVETGVRGRFERCAVGALDGTDVVVCTSVDHGSLTTGVFTQLSVDDSARLLDTMREQIVTPHQGTGAAG
ncbi:Agglutinin receptor precursor [Micromonospora sp. MW-13]|nr:Agglutinin receptor precursor [Micromonospora sp. MW-13]